MPDYGSPVARAGTLTGLTRSQYYYKSSKDDSDVMDDCNREALVIEIATSIAAKRAICTLEQLIDWRGKPATIRVNNGPEFTSADFMNWCKVMGIIHYTQPGKPMQNGYIERFNGSYRREILNAYLLFDLEEVRQLTEQWMKEYNTRRPHEVLGNLTPSERPLKSRSGNVENLPRHTLPAPQAYHIPTS